MLSLTRRQHSGRRAGGSVLVLAAAVLACENPPPRAAAPDTSAAPDTMQESVRDTLRRTPLVTDTSVSFVVPIRDCIATTARDSTDRVRLGERLFKAKGCARCHKLAQGYADGPDLAGVTMRRTCDWLVALLTDTENMIQTDPDLQQLRIEHFLDMPDHELSVLEARALYAFLRAATAPDTVRR